ncbi:MAG: NAD-dependent epimerase/dehydratase family protein [Bilophila wadsworthia]
MGKILVTGGTGYLGTHMLVELVKQGYEPLCVDNLHNSNPSVLAVKEICGKEIPFTPTRATSPPCALFAEYQIDAVIHFAGHKAVGEPCAPAHVLPQQL